MSLTEAYKLFRELADQDWPEGVDADYVGSQLDEACNCILRVLYDVDRQAYVGLVAWDAGRVTLTPGVTCEDVR